MADQDCGRPLVSVLCATYQYGQFVRAAIDSVLGQTYDRVEMIVVDDGSTDSTAAVLATYGERIRTITTENRGQNAAFNLAFENSSGTVVCLLDSDDLMHSDKVACVVAELGRRPEAQWLFHDLRYVDAAAALEVASPVLALHELPRPGMWDLRAAMRGGRAPITAPAASGLVFRRELLNRIMPLPELADFGDHYIKFAAMGLAPGVVIADRLADQRIHARNAYTNRRDIGLLRARVMVNTARELENLDASMAPFADVLLLQGLLMSAFGSRLPPAEKQTVAGWWTHAGGPRRARLVGSVLTEVARRYRLKVRSVLGR